MDTGFEIVIGLAFFGAAFALLGFVIGEMHGRPKLNRDKRTGRFVRKYARVVPAQNLNTTNPQKYDGMVIDPMFMEIGDGPSWWTEPQGEVITTVQVQDVDTETNTIWLTAVSKKK